MPVRSLINQYQGINAHLHSLLLAQQRWNRFHNAFIEHVTHALNVQLRPMGYLAEAEESMQVRRMTERRAPRSDITIYDTMPSRGTLIQRSAGSVAELSLDALLQELDVEHPYMAVAIYQRVPDDQSGEQVAWIELLSPSNKGDHPDAYTYRSKRDLLISSGLVFVEIDFIHDAPPTFARLPDYTRASEQDSAYPYRIVMIDPRPSWKEGRAILTEMRVDQPVPQVLIPLNRGDHVLLDVQPVYDYTFSYKFYGDLIDYLTLPQAFERYSAEDQARIVSRMVAVCEAAQTGHPLTKALEDVPQHTLEEGLARLEALRTALAQ